jgi:hypothetical protein
VISRSGHPITRLSSNLRRWTTVILAATIGCSEATIITAPETRTTFAGFDTSIYPGDAALRAWMKPGSPYEWVGYYLEAPCHRDGTWSGKRASLTGMGWGLAVIYVGQQTFDGVAAIDPAATTRSAGPLSATPKPSSAHTTIIEDKGPLPTCSRTLLSREQGLAEADDAIAKTAAQGFSAGSVIYLDLERMETITPAMEAYYGAWIERTLSDGRFFPGIYCHKFNAASIYARASEILRAAGVSRRIPFWIASSAGFAIDKHPTDVGYDFASAWQGILDTNQTWSGVTIHIDVDIADTRSPSAP